VIFSRLLLSLIAATALVQSIRAELLIVDSAGDRVMLASSFDGSILNPTFIQLPNQPSGSSFVPINAIDSGRGTIFVSDQLSDDVKEYSYSGTLIGTVVSTPLDNIRGITVRDSMLYITVEAGSLVDTVQRFDLTTNTLSTFISDPLFVTASPSFWDITFRASDALVMNSTDGLIYRYDLNGNRIGPFTSQPFTTGRQISLNPNGDVLLGTITGVARFDSNGSFLGSVGSGSTVGVYPLENGNLLYGGGTSLSTYNPNLPAPGTSVVLTGTQYSFRFIEPISIPEPTAFAFLAFTGTYLCRIRRNRKHSLRDYPTSKAPSPPPPLP
jgi:hypothetical protein